MEYCGQVKNIYKKGLDHINLWEITIKCYSDHIKHRYELVNETKSNPKELL